MLVYQRVLYLHPSAQVRGTSCINVSETTGHFLGTIFSEKPIQIWICLSQFSHFFFYVKATHRDSGGFQATLMVIKLLKIAIEIVDLPIQNGDFP